MRIRRRYCSRSGLLHGFQFVIPFAALFGMLAVSIAAPLRSQTPPATSFDELERSANEARQANQLDKAVVLYREGLKLRPSWNEGTWYLGTSLFALKRYEEARDAFRHLAISQPDNGPAWALAGMCEFELKNYARAQEFLSRADGAGLADNKELASLVSFRIALLETRDGAFEKALSRLLSLAAIGTYPEVIESLGICVLRTPLLLSEVPEQDHDLYRRAGEAMYASVTHDNDGAARLFEELVTAYPNHPNVHYARGAFLMDSDPAKAMQEFQRELEINPSQPNALVQVTRLYLKQGAADKAVPLARKVVEISPTVAAPHRLLGESLLASGQTPAAIEELQTAARLEPDFPQTHFLLADAYRKQGKGALASKEMVEFQRLDTKEKSSSTAASPVK